MSTDELDVFTDARIGRATVIGEGRDASRRSARVLEHDARDDAAPVVHQSERVLEPLERKAVGDDRIEIDEALAQEGDHVAHAAVE